MTRGRATVEFGVEHFWGLLTVRGHFKEFHGQLDLSADPAIELTITATSVNRCNRMRDRHLRSSDFLDAENHPRVRFLAGLVAQQTDVLRVRGRLSAASRGARYSPTSRRRSRTPVSREQAAEPRGEGPGLSKSEPLGRALVEAIHTGDVESLRGLLREHPGVAAARLVDEKGGSGTLLHAATDWPGYFPRGPEIVALLIEAGGDPNAPVRGSWHAETPLHWAASSDDVEVARALIDGGADLEACGASIAGGAPLDDAVGYGCWQVARLLVERGARVDRLWHAAALGMISRVDELVAATSPTLQELTDAFWQACHGGQRRMAEHLLALGAELNGTPSWGDDTPLDVADGLGTGREALVTWLRDRGAVKSSKAGT